VATPSPKVVSGMRSRGRRGRREAVLFPAQPHWALLSGSGILLKAKGWNIGRI